MVWHTSETGLSFPTIGVIPLSVTILSISVKVESQEDEIPLLCCSERWFTEMLLGLFSLCNAWVCRLKQSDDPANSLQIPVTQQHISRFSICLPQLPCKPKSSPVGIHIFCSRALCHFDPSVTITELK